MKVSNTKWIVIFISLFLAISIGVGMVNYFVDPFFCYRMSDNEHFLIPHYVSPGLIKHYDYDTLILGSSMIQNFNMDSFRTKLKCNPLHVGVSSITPEEILKYIELSENIGKTQKYYICIDTSTFASKGTVRTEEFLFKSDVLSDIKYLYNYESLFQFLPVDLMLTASKKLGFFPDSFSAKTSIDKLGNWEDEYEFDEEILIDNYNANMYEPSKLDKEKFEEQSRKVVDNFFTHLNSDDNYTFFFPPYSSLYWYDRIEDDEFSCLINAKRYFIEKAKLFGAEVFDFQGADFTVDLNLYKDTTHYSPEINDWMVNCFSNGSFCVSAYDSSASENAIIDNVSLMKQKYKELIG